MAAAADGSSGPSGDCGSPQAPPARRPARDRAAKSTDLAASFTKYVDAAPPDEVKDLTDQLQKALGSIANGVANNAEDTESAGNNDGNGGDGASAPQRGRGRRRPNSPPDGGSNSPLKSSLTTSTSPLSASLTRPAGDEYYAPKSTSRRNSRAGSELAASMKLAAQKALAELGEVADEDDEDLIRAGVLEGVREESVRNLLKEDSKYGDGKHLEA